MQPSDIAFSGSVPEIYDRLMVPLIFEPYAADMAGRVAALRPGRILETAAGTGVVTRALQAVLPAGTEIVATDLNPAMLARAEEHAGAGRVVWQQADALALPFADGGFDAVVCQFGIMFFPDRIRGYGEARRVLRPGGRFLFNVWDRLEENDFVRVISAALERAYPDDPPRFMARTPHGHHDIPLIRAELALAGFTDVSVESVGHVARAETALQAAMAYCQGTPLRGEIEGRGGELGEVTAQVADALSQAFGPGPVAGGIRASVIVAR